LNLDEERVSAFILKVERGYCNPNPYHNRLHAADIVHGTYYMLSQASALLKQLPPLELFSVLLAALIHDLGHDGLNNNFHRATESDLAQKYPNSILESYHLAQGMRYASEDETNPFKGLTKAQEKSSREFITDLVLMTDMSKHSSYVARLEEGGSELVGGGDVESQRVACTVALMCADLSNATKELKIASRWASRIMAEMFNVGEKMSELGIPLPPNFDRKSTCTPKCQANTTVTLTQTYTD